MINNKPSEEYKTLEEVVERYKAIMIAVYSSPKFKPEEK